MVERMYCDYCSKETGYARANLKVIKIDEDKIELCNDCFKAFKQALDTFKNQTPEPTQ